jgi:hypothetical protein
MKRKLKWIGVVLVVLVLGFGTALFLWPRDRITVKSYKQIRIGMTEKEAQEVLGGPGVNVDVAEGQWDRLEAQMGKPPLVLKKFQLQEGPWHWKFVPESTNVWIGRSGIIWIEFDKDCLVKATYFQEAQSTEPNFIDRIRDWLGW